QRSPQLRRGDFLLGTQVGGKGCTWEVAGHAVGAMQVRLSEAAYVWLHSRYGFWDSSGSHQSVRNRRTGLMLLRVTKVQRSSRCMSFCLPWNVICRALCCP